MKLVNWTPSYRDGKYYVEGYTSQGKICEQIIFVSKYTAKDEYTIHTDKNIYVCNLNNLLTQIGDEYFKGYGIVERADLHGEGYFGRGTKFAFNNQEIHYIAESLIHSILDIEVIGEEEINLVKNTGSLSSDMEKNVKDYISITYLSSYEVENLEEEINKVYIDYLDILKET